VLTRRQILAAAALAPFARAVPLADFKLGVTTDEIDEDLTTALRFLRSYDLKWAELRSVWGSYAEKQPIEKIKQMRALLDEYQIKPSILATSFFKVPLPVEGSPALDQQWKLLDDAMDRAEILGTKKLRTFGSLIRIRPIRRFIPGSMSWSPNPLGGRGSADFCWL